MVRLPSPRAAAEIAHPEIFKGLAKLKINWGEYEFIYRQRSSAINFSV